MAKKKIMKYRALKSFCNGGDFNNVIPFGKVISRQQLMYSDKEIQNLVALGIVKLVDDAVERKEEKIVYLNKEEKHISENKEEKRGPGRPPKR